MYRKESQRARIEFRSNLIKTEWIQQIEENEAMILKDSAVTTLTGEP